MDIVISVVLNWDRDANIPKPGCGIFGEVTAYYGSTESQSSTRDLHGHMMVWVAGFLATVSEYENMPKSAAFKQKLIDYVDSVVTSDLPIQHDGKCPECGYIGLEAVTLISAHTKKCQHGIENLDVSAAAVSDGATFTRTASLKPFKRVGEQSKLEDVLNTRSMLSFQSHHWYHSRSCFKRTKQIPNGKVCRMFFPKESCDATKWTSANCIEHARKLGNEYVNAHVPEINNINNTLKWNHNVKLMEAEEAAK
ncbi:hypothetical protein PHMEG_0006581 [Phytophthora megakarya]|uniref:Helitron helicase n=1 Tax=Phytophthora megakarya TaxID=4795 RepID=A0A225WNM4_9STRA|nr:hypothetical protein PHMEG_0006581 [Phytophthora megakarya]